MGKEIKEQADKEVQMSVQALRSDQGEKNKETNQVGVMLIKLRGKDFNKRRHKTDSDELE